MEEYEWGDSTRTQNESEPTSRGERRLTLRQMFVCVCADE